MLTRELALTHYDGAIAIPDRLTRHRHAHYLALAEAMIATYQEGMGKTREELHREVHSLFANEEACPVRRIQAFSKLLDEAAEFEHESVQRAAALRIKVFKAAAQFHPLVTAADPWFEHEEQSAKQKIAAELNMPWLELEGKLFSDLLQYHRLKLFDRELTPADLLARYNVAQVQVCLFDAVKMTVTARADFKHLLRYAKLAGLMHRIQRIEGGYRIEFDGPASVLQHTHRYGVLMAKFLPGLLACKDWSMKALLKVSRWNRRAVLELDSNSGLSSRAAKATEFDSTVEAKFAERWGAEPREGWTLERESEVLHEGQKVFVPDFTFVHSSGQRASLEIVGFWTPEYLRDKLATLAAFRTHHILLAVQESHREAFSEFAESLVGYKTALKIEAVLELLRGFDKTSLSQ
jgi:predicted nuclease of restriction endonuclease-like RecB superfamily